MLNTLILASATLVQPSAPPDHPVALQWNTFGLVPKAAAEPAAQSAALSFAAPGPVLVQALLNSGGLLGGAKTGAASCTTWTLTDKGLSPATPADDKAPRLDALPSAPTGWFVLDATKRENAGAILTVDLNALRAGGAEAEKLFDAPWLQHLLDRLALNNARTVSLRGTIHPATADGLPPLLELKAFANARSESPAAKAQPLTLIAPGWGGTPTEAAAVKDASWAASIRADAGGLGEIGRDGGVGTWAGLVRLAADAVITVTNDDPKKAQQQYAAFQERTADTLRPLGSRLQPRATLACYGTAEAPSLVMIVPSRKGEQPEAFSRAVEQFAKAAGMTGKDGVFAVTSTDPLVPKLAITACTAADSPWLVASVERDDSRPMLRRAIERLTAAK